MRIAKKINKIKLFYIYIYNVVLSLREKAKYTHHA